MRPTQAGDPGQGPNTLEPLLITMRELEHLLGCGKTTAFAIVGKGDIEAVMVGRRRMPVLESARAYVQRLREQSKQPVAA